MKEGVFIDVSRGLAEFERSIERFARDQLPFATAQALTEVARFAVEDEKKNEAAVLDRPRPFTQNAIRVIPARKGKPVAEVYMMDIAARYLRPYEFGGTNVLNSKVLLKPVGAKDSLDQFGNLPRRYVAQMKQRSDVFVGTVKTKAGEITGLWQRAGKEDSYATQTRITKSGKVIVKKVASYVSSREGRQLKLLVKFEDAHDVRQNLDWFGVAERSIDKNLQGSMQRALVKALATAR